MKIGDIRRKMSFLSFRIQAPFSGQVARNVDEHPESSIGEQKGERKGSARQNNNLGDILGEFRLSGPFWGSDGIILCQIITKIYIK